MTNSWEQEDKIVKHFQFLFRPTAELRAESLSVQPSLADNEKEGLYFFLCLKAVLGSGLPGRTVSVYPENSRISSIRSQPGAAVSGSPGLHQPIGTKTPLAALSSQINFS